MTGVNRRSIDRDLIDDHRQRERRRGKLETCVEDGKDKEGERGSGRSGEKRRGINRRFTIGGVWTNRMTRRNRGRRVCVVDNCFPEEFVIDETLRQREGGDIIVLHCVR